MNLALQLVPIALAVLALIVAVMAYRLDRLSSAVHAVSCRIHPDPPVLAPGEEADAEAWVGRERTIYVSLALVGPGRMLAVTPCAWGTGDWKKRIQFKGGGAKWEPGDPPLKFTIKLPSGESWPEDLKVGYYWAAPRLFREGLLDHAQRFAVRSSEHDDDKDAVERWGRYRHAWRPVRTPRWFTWPHSTKWLDGVVASGKQV